MYRPGGGDTLPGCQENVKMDIRRTYINLALTLIAAGILVSCVQKENPDAYLADEYITLGAGSGDSTKALLSNSDLSYNGMVFQTYDYVSGYNGTISGHTNGEEFQYFSNTLTYKSDATSWKWLFGDVSSPTSYRWTRTGTHKFFGWMLTDGHDASNLNTSSVFSTYSTSFDDANDVHTVNLGNALTVDSPQYDFLYSDIVNVAVADGIPNHVDLPMKHLFGALGVSIRNNSELDVVVYSVSFQNFPNQNTVALEYGDLTSGVNLSGSEPTANSTAYLSNKLSSAITLYNRDHATLAGKIYDAFTGDDITDSDPNYRLAWPVKQTSLVPTVSSYDDDGNPVYSADSPLILVDCKVGTQARKVLKLKFPSISSTSTKFITAGKMTHLALQFLDKQISLSFSVKDWQFEKYPMAYEGDAISSTQLKFTLNTYSDGGTETINGVKHSVIKLTSSSSAGSYMAVGTFKIFSPVNGILSVGLGGNVDDFTVSLQSGDTTTGGTESITINPNRDNGKITLTIRPKGTPQSGSRVFLHFAVRNNGRDSDADTEINRDGYIVEIP